MRALVQRVSRASVSVEGEVVAGIGPGVLVLLGVTHDDTPEVADRLGPTRSGRCGSSPTPRAG